MFAVHQVQTELLLRPSGPETVQSHFNAAQHEYPKPEIIVRPITKPKWYGGARRRPCTTSTTCARAIYRHPPWIRHAGISQSATANFPQDVGVPRRYDPYIILFAQLCRL